MRQSMAAEPDKQANDVQGGTRARIGKALRTPLHSMDELGNANGVAYPRWPQPENVCVHVVVEHEYTTVVSRRTWLFAGRLDTILALGLRAPLRMILTRG